MIMKYIAAMLLFIYMYNPNNATETSTYTTQYDGIDLNEILTNDRLLTSYIQCLLERGPCTPDGKELKKNLPDAIQNDCKKCTKRQQEGAEQVMHYIIDHRPDDWNKLEEKYDSDGSYKTKYFSTKTVVENSTNITNAISENSKNTSEE